MAPEISAEEPASADADLYACGVLFYHLGSDIIHGGHKYLEHALAELGKKSGENMLGSKYGRERQRRRDLRTVDQCKPFLGAQTMRLDARSNQRGRGTHDLAVHADLTDTEQRTGHVCERCKVAARTYRSLRRDQRVAS